MVNSAGRSTRKPANERFCVAASGDELEIEIVVVDNASRPQQRPCNLPDNVTVLFNESNRGYAAGMNQALAYSRGELVLFSNPDTWYFPGALQALVDAVHTLPRAGAVGPRLWWDRQRRLLLPPADSATLAEQTLRQLVYLRPGWPEPFAKRWLTRALEYWKAKAPIGVKALSGACILTRRQVIREVGPLNEDFHLYFEDADWCRRLGKKGYLLYCVPEADTVHYYNQSGKQEPAAQKWFADSEQVYFRKHYGALGNVTRRLVQKMSGLARRPLGLARRPLLNGVIDLGRRRERPTLVASVGAEVGPFWMLFSPESTFVPAAGGLIQRLPYRVPTEVWNRLQEGPLFARVVSADDLDFKATWKWEKEGPRG